MLVELGGQEYKDEQFKAKDQKKCMHNDLSSYPQNTFSFPYPFINYFTFALCRSIYRD